MLARYRRADDPKTDRTVEVADPPDRLMFINDVGWYRRVRAIPRGAATYVARELDDEELDALLDRIVAEIVADPAARCALHLENPEYIRQAVTRLVEGEFIDGRLLVAFPA